MPKMNLSRKVLGWPIVTRLRHAHFTDYYERFRYKDEDI